MHTHAANDMGIWVATPRLTFEDQPKTLLSRLVGTVARQKMRRDDDQNGAIDLNLRHKWRNRTTRRDGP